MAYLSGSHAPPAVPAGNHGGGGCPRKTAALGTGKPADKLICRQRFFLPGKRPQRQPADLCRAPFPGLEERRRGMERRGEAGNRRTPPPPPHPNTQFHLAKASQGVIQAEPTLANLGLRISPSRAGREGKGTVPVPSPTPPRPSAARLQPKALPAPSGPVDWAPGLGTSLVATEPIGKPLSYRPQGRPLPTAFGQKQKETQTFVSPY